MTQFQGLCVTSEWPPKGFVHVFGNTFPHQDQLMSISQGYWDSSVCAWVIPLSKFTNLDPDSVRNDCQMYIANLLRQQQTDSDIAASKAAFRSHAIRKGSRLVTTGSVGCTTIKKLFKFPESVGQKRVGRCGVCEEIGHNKRTCTVKRSKTGHSCSIYIEYHHTEKIKTDLEWKRFGTRPDL